jgi:hypothetical protein
MRSWLVRWQMDYNFTVSWKGWGGGANCCAVSLYGSLFIIQLQHADVQGILTNVD